LLDEGYTAAPEADKTVSTKLAGLVARARKEKCLTNVIQFVDEELLHLAFRSLRKQAAPGVDGQSYEDYAANLDQNLKNVHARLTTGRYKAPVIRRVYIPKGNGKRRPIGIRHGRRPNGAEGGGMGAQCSFRARLPGLLTWVPTYAQRAYGPASPSRGNAGAPDALRDGNGSGELLRHGQSRMA
jgi:hypothetical protein